ncbi:MAG: sigma-70 family RNA polymerase sigma factor [Cyanobacteria bacterium J06642_2]
MTPRQDLVQLFSTFMRFEADRFGGWLTDASLRRSMKARLSHTSHLAESGWAEHWHGQWQLPVDDSVAGDSASDSALDRARLLARSHLMAYLQEPCFWAARKTLTAFDQTSLTAADGFQVAIAEIERVLKGFDPERGTGLKSYASVIFANVIRDRLRQQREVDVCTPWALLRKVSQKRLGEALLAAGWSEIDSARRTLAWSCFKTIYVPTAEANSPVPKATRQLQRPSRDTWMAIAELYNSRRLELAGGEPSCSPEELTEWLEVCATAVRAYVCPEVASLNAPTGSGESGEWLDRLPAGEKDSLLAAAVVAEEVRERQERWRQMQAVLHEAISALPETSQLLLQLYYREQARQQEIADRLQIKQYTVSRRLTKVRQILLQALATWSRDVLHISLTTAVLQDISVSLEAWLETSYARADADSHSSNVVEPLS